MTPGPEVLGVLPLPGGSSDPQAELFRAVFAQAVDAMFILDDERTIVDANAAASALFGVSTDVLVTGRLDVLIVHRGDEMDIAWRELLAFGEAKREHQVVTTTGMRLVECCYRAHVQRDRHLCVARDITERRALEERLAQSEKIESIGRLAGGIAHDFNNLLTAILGYTELLLSERSTADPDRKDLQQIQKAGQRAADLTQQLLAFGRKQVLMPKEVDLNQTVANLETMLARSIREDITLTCVLAERPAILKIDPAQIEQVIVNLVLNARDALVSDGHIRIEVTHVGGDEVELPPDLHTAAAEYVRLRVIDTGIGIPAEARPHLFEPFFTTKEMGKGTGLGLASVYGIVRQSNGFIAVESEPGNGTTFTMHFPAVEPTRTGGLTLVAAQTAKSAQPETILLVEDEDAVRAIVGAVLRRQGYNILEAATPTAAVEIFDEHVGAIDLLVTDVVMPEMSGPALAQRLVALRPELRILFISGYADYAIPLGEENPNVSFLGKPFQASTLTGRVKEILNRVRQKP